MLPKWSVMQIKKFNTFEKNFTVETVIYIWLMFNKCVCTHTMPTCALLLDSVLGTRKKNVNYYIVSDLTRKIHTIGMLYMNHNFYLHFIEKEVFPWWLRW